MVVPIENINVMENPEVASPPTILLLNDKEEIVETWHCKVRNY